jgi:hypothetical protein
MTPLLVLIGTSVCAMLASAVIARSSNRSAAWNLAFGALGGIAVFAVALLIAYLMTRAAFPWLR